MCLQYKPTVVACFCIHLACKWSNWEIPQSTEGKPWFWYIDKTVSQELLEQLTEEFLAIFEKCPSRLKKKIVSLSQNQNPTILSQFNSNKDEKKRNGEGPSAGLFPTGCSLSTAEEMKKKQEFQRHHPEYKKHHMSAHHSRPEAPSVSSKSSCMFGPPQRTQPSSHSSITSSHQNRSISKSVAPDGSNLGKPEHLHHRPRRPEDKHPRNHEQIPPPYKKFDSKVPGGAVNEFSQPSSNANSRSGLFNTTTTGSYQMAPPVMHPLGPPEQNQSVQPSVPKIAPIPPRIKTPPPTVKIERSIFSPEKCTPPPESLIKPLPPTPPPTNPAPSFFPKVAVKEEPVVKSEPVTPVEIKQEISISPKEEKPPDLTAIDHPVEVEIPPLAPLQSQTEEHHTHKESKKHKKEKKKHREHKEKHKDKHKHKHKNREVEQPQQNSAGEALSLIIKIPKEQINLTPQPETLKIKIPRDKLTTPKAPGESPLKIKISQGKIKESKKRDRSEERSPGLPSKYHRPNGTTTLQVKKLELLSCTNIKQEFNNVDFHSPPSVHFDQDELGGDLNSPPNKLQYHAHSPPSVIPSPPPVGGEVKVQFTVPQDCKPTLSASCPPLVNVKQEFPGVNVEVHSPPSVNFDDFDSGNSMECSPPLPDLNFNVPKIEVCPRLSPLESKAVEEKPEVGDRSNVGFQNHWKFSQEYKPNFASRGGILYRGRGRGPYRPPRGNILYRDFPNRTQWGPRPQGEGYRPYGEGYRGSYRGVYNPQQRPAIRHQHQRPPHPRHPHPQRMSYSHCYTDQTNHFPEHFPNSQHFPEQQTHFVEQQNAAFPQLQQHYYQQALYVSQYQSVQVPLQRSANKNPPPLPEGPPPENPPPPPPPPE